MNSEQLEQLMRQGVDIELTASAVHRLMNERYLQAILTAIKKAALSQGWHFQHTKEEHLMPFRLREHLASVIWPASVGHCRPNLRSSIGPETYEEWRRDAELEGWSGAWLDGVLDALRQLGIRPVPCENVEDLNAL
ncbi:hypothetical protein GIW79_22915 [Pseudomonas sp. PA-7-1E]|uniref:hypothetical protein n=1 Tax=Gammaproteobacteria TaxID=1236 RepID=UPI001933A379|nr:MULTISPECIES: hypothetical protein [Gammaproteobacteria]MBM0557854.1 hypothetical protein [Escherichia coli]MCF4988331.1 hypothetical protein [Pseudomonas gessardii]MCF5043304.1 hypothetical protein [Pseudomonas sp. PA-7-1E]MCF5131283.1 hypothetical protein [Pseudomonas sp. PA-6-4F]